MKKLLGLLLIASVGTQICADPRYNREESREERSNREPEVKGENVLTALCLGAISGLAFTEAVITVFSKDRLGDIPAPIKGVGLLALMGMLASGRMDAVQNLLGSKYIGVSSLAAGCAALIRLANYPWPR
jgi:hypothetical protein